MIDPRAVGRLRNPAAGWQPCFGAAHREFDLR